MTNINTQHNPYVPACGHGQSSRETAADRSNPAPDDNAINGPNATTDAAQGGDAKTVAKTSSSADTYSPADRKTIEELKARDRDVRAHEAAHRSAAGMYARGATSFTYQRGPDGGSYAIGGEVSIDVSPVQGDAHATAQKARQIQAAALAPAQPSGQDLAVAAQAAQMALQASTESHGSASSENKNGSEKKVDENSLEVPKSGATPLHDAERNKSTEFNGRAKTYDSMASSKSETNPSLNVYA